MTMNAAFEAVLSGDTAEGGTDGSGDEKAPQHTPNEAGDRPILELNDGWRVAHDGALQWILQRSSVKRGTTIRRWQGRRFHAERDSLLRSIAELCGAVDPSAVETIKGWQPRYRPDLSGQAAIPTLLPMAAE